MDILATWLSTTDSSAAGSAQKSHSINRISLWPIKMRILKAIGKISDQIEGIQNESNGHRISDPLHTQKDELFCVKCKVSNLETIRVAYILHSVD